MIKKLILLALVGYIPTVCAIIDDNKSTAQEPASRREKLYEKSLESKKVIEEFKQYLHSLPEDVIDEIEQYRKKIAKINREKKRLYKKLSQQAQLYLAKEQEFKKKLPITQKKSLNKLRKEYLQQDQAKPNAPSPAQGDGTNDEAALTIPGQ